jgi:hypothetical protein
MLSKNTYCCQKKGVGSGNQTENHRRSITCRLARPDLQHGDSDMSGGGDHELIAGIIGSLIVLLLAAIFVVLLVQILRKRRHRHTPPGEGSGYRNRGTRNTYTHREPSPYECPVREPKSQEYAELEREQPTGSGNRYAEQNLDHLYEDADKYFRGNNGGDYAVSGYQLTGKGQNGQRPQFNCIITPPPEDDYASPDDAVANNTGVTAAPHETDSQKSTAVEEPQTKEVEQHDYALLENDLDILKGNGAATGVEVEGESETSPVSIQD